MPIATDKLMLMADGLAQALDRETFTTEFTVAWMPNPLALLEDLVFSSAVVWVIDFAEKSETLNGVPLDEYELLVVAQRKIGKSETAADICREMSRLVSEIAQHCRNIAINDAVCFKVERTAARDFKQLHENNLYRAEISTHWRRVHDTPEEE